MSSNFERANESNFLLSENTKLAADNYKASPLHALFAADYSCKTQRLCIGVQQTLYQLLHYLNDGKRRNTKRNRTACGENNTKHYNRSIHLIVQSQTELATKQHKI